MVNETMCDICGKLYPITELSVREARQNEKVLVLSLDGTELGEGKVIVCPHCL